MGKTGHKRASNAKSSLHICLEIVPHEIACLMFSILREMHQGWIGPMQISRKGGL